MYVPWPATPDSSDSNAFSKGVVLGYDGSGNPIFIGFAYDGFIEGEIDVQNQCIYSACDLKGTFECVPVRHGYSIIAYE